MISAKKQKQISLIETTLKTQLFIKVSLKSGGSLISEKIPFLKLSIFLCSDCMFLAVAKVFTRGHRLIGDNHLIIVTSCEREVNVR